MFSHKALQKNVTALFYRGLMTEHGFGTEMNEAKAFLFYQLAAAGNEPNAKMVMAYRHHVGIGAKKDCNAALTHYRPLADQGF